MPSCREERVPQTRKLITSPGLLIPPYRDLTPEVKWSMEQTLDISIRVQDANDHMFPYVAHPKVV